MNSVRGAVKFKKYSFFIAFSVLFLANCFFVPQVQAGPGPVLTTTDDIARPFVRITSPEDGFLTNQSLITIVIQYKNIETLTFNGNAVAIQPGSNSISVTFFLEEGVNTLTAIGQYNSLQASHSIQVTLDVLHPLIMWKIELIR